MKLRHIIGVAAGIALLAGLGGCSKSKSYSELLRDEERACNWYLAQHEVVTRIPEDSVFEVGPDAPFYRMTSDGNLYMRVVNAGDKSYRAKEGDRVYFVFMRQNIEYLKDGVIDADTWEGNAENMASQSASFLLGETTLTSSTQYGTGIQVPMKYLGYYSEVELVVKSLEGFTSDQNACVPYIYKIRYFPAEY